MLPGFRFLFAAILLSASILVFGLGAAALLRATHEQYVSTPSWRNGPQEQVFAQASEPVQPVLAALRAEPEAAEPAPSLRDKIPTIGMPASEPEQVAAVTSDAEVQQSQVADAAPADDPAAEAAKTETAAPATSDTLSPADTTASIAEVKAAPTTTSEPTPTDNSAAQISSAPDIASAGVATLNDPAITPLAKAKTEAKVKTEAKAKADTKAASSVPESKATKRRMKAKKRHRVARRPPPPQQVQQSFNPFAQQQPTLTATTTRTRQ